MISFVIQGSEPRMNFNKFLIYRNVLVYFCEYSIALKDVSKKSQIIHKENNVKIYKSLMRVLKINAR